MNGWKRYPAETESKRISPFRPNRVLIPGINFTVQKIVNTHANPFVKKLDLLRVTSRSFGIQPAPIRCNSYRIESVEDTAPSPTTDANEAHGAMGNQAQCDGSGGRKNGYHTIEPRE